MSKRIRLKSQPKEEVEVKVEQKKAKILCTNKPIPQRNDDNKLYFEDYPEFLPNLTPKEVLQLGSFGGTYFRPIYSSVLKQNLKDMHLELPDDWLKNLNIKQQVTSSNYCLNVNKYKAKCGGSLEMWETSGWINGIDPYGWFQWYCRFYQGRRTSDDERQIKRGIQCFGPGGRWRTNLYNKCIRANTNFDDETISPVIRQVLQHWGYQPNQKDFELAKKKYKK